MSERMESPERIRRRQAGVAFAILGALFAGVLGTLVLTDPARRLGAATDNHVYENKYRTPGDAVDPRKAWIASSEADMDTLRENIETRDREVERQLSEMRGMVETILQRRVGESTARSPDARPVPAEAGARQRERRPSRARTAGTLLPRPPGLPSPEKAGTDTAPVAAPGPGGEVDGSAAGRAAMTTPAGGGVVLDQVARRVQSRVRTDNRNEQARLVKVEFSAPTSSSAHIRDTIPAGSFGRAVLLTGLDAPTGGRAQSDPHPVLLQVVDNGKLPNRYRHRTKECRILASGYGNLSDERAYIRLEKLSCVLRNGEIVSRPVKGYVSGEDGKNGLRGELHNKQGTLIARSFLAGLFSGIGDGIAQSYTNLATSAQGAVQTVDPKRIFEHGGAVGVSNSLEKIADWYLERADEVFPVIAIDGGRTVEVTFTDDVSLGANLLERYTPAKEDY